MLQFDWVKNWRTAMASRSPELGIRQKNKNLAKPYQFKVIRIGKKLANP